MIPWSPSLPSFPILTTPALPYVHRLLVFNKITWPDASYLDICLLLILIWVRLQLLFTKIRYSTSFKHIDEFKLVSLNVAFASCALVANTISTKNHVVDSLWGIFEFSHYFPIYTCTTCFRELISYYVFLSNNFNFVILANFHACSCC